MKMIRQLPAAVLLLTVAPLLQAASLEDQVRSCRTMTDDDARLACYDGLTPDTTAPAEGAETERKPIMKRLTDAVGFERRRKKEKERVTEQRFDVTITNCDNNSANRRVSFSLENGQVWRQKNSRWMSMRNCESRGVISKGYFGYKLYIEAMDQTFGVIRIQ